MPSPGTRSRALCGATASGNWNSQGGVNITAVAE